MRIYPLFLLGKLILSRELIYVRLPRGPLFATYSQNGAARRKDIEMLAFTRRATSFNFSRERRVRAVALISEAVKTPRRRLGSIKPSHQVTDFVSAANFSLTICNAGNEITLSFRPLFSLMLI